MNELSRELIAEIKYIFQDLKETLDYLKTINRDEETTDKINSIETCIDEAVDHCEDIS